jgi:hypothetical protein
VGDDPGRRDPALRRLRALARPPQAKRARPCQTSRVRYVRPGPSRCFVIDRGRIVARIRSDARVKRPPHWRGPRR